MDGKQIKEEVISYRETGKNKISLSEWTGFRLRCLFIFIGGNYEHIFFQSRFLVSFNGKFLSSCNIQITVVFIWRRLD